MPLIIAKPFKQSGSPPISGLCAGGESDYFGPTFWTEDNSNIVWDAANTHYDLAQASDFQNSLNAIGGAWAGFRPSAAKFFVTMNSDAFGSDDWSFTVKDTTNATIGSTGAFQPVGGPYPNSATFTVPLTFGANDIGSVDIVSFSYDTSDTLDGICFVP